MNINNFIPNYRPEDIPAITMPTITSMLGLRSVVFRRFAATESRHGLLTLDRPLMDSKSQDSLRMLVYRFIEELFESRDAVDQPHVLEEAIDALNYLLALGMIEAAYDPEHLNSFQVQLTEAVFGTIDRWDTFRQVGMLPIRSFMTDELQGCLEPIFHDLSPKLRNRAWMNETQHTDFAYKELLEVITTCLEIILQVFCDWDQFYTYYRAKHDVLIFRLNSQY